MEQPSQNRGRIVRSVMDGHEGQAYQWCAGFATAMYQNAAKFFGLPDPFAELGTMRYSSSAIFRFAEKKGWLVDRPINGDIFLVRGGIRSSHKHTAMVARVHQKGVILVSFDTVEGNLRDKVTISNRTPGGIDFVRVPI